MTVCYTVPEIQHLMSLILIFHFGLFFALLPPKQLKKPKFLKSEKKEAWRYHHFTNAYQKLLLHDV